MSIRFGKFDIQSAFEITQMLIRNEGKREIVFEHLMRVIMAKLFVSRAVILRRQESFLSLVLSKGILSSETSYESIDRAKISLRLAHFFKISFERETWGYLGIGPSLILQRNLSEDEYFFLNGMLSFFQIVLQYEAFVKGKNDLIKQVNKNVQRMVSLFNLSEAYQLDKTKEYALKTFYRILAAEFLISHFAAVSVSPNGQRSTLASLGVDDSILAGFQSISEVPVESMSHPVFSIQCFFQVDDEKVFIFLGRSIRSQDHISKEFLTLALQQLKYFWQIKNYIHKSIEQVLEKKSIEEEMRLARETQQALLPRTLTFKGIDLFVSMHVSKNVGGDYYEVLPLSSSRLFVAIADVCGKGIPAAMLMANLQATLRALLSMELSKSSLTNLVQRLNTILYGSLTRDKFVTMACAIINLEKRNITCVNAGHNPPMLLRKKKIVKLFSKGGTLLGAFPNICYEQEVTSFKQDDMLFFYTDGMTEARNEQQKEFGESYLIQILEGIPSDYSSKQVVETTLNHLSSFTGGNVSSPNDDVTLLCAKM